MPRRPAAVTQADIARALRAAKSVGGWRVEIAPGGVISLTPCDGATSEPARPHGHVDPVAPHLDFVP